jgi:hypothetical protein
VGEVIIGIFDENWSCDGEVGDDGCYGVDGVECGRPGVMEV